MDKLELLKHSALHLGKDVSHLDILFAATVHNVWSKLGMVKVDRNSGPTYQRILYEGSVTLARGIQVISSRLERQYYLVHLLHIPNICTVITYTALDHSSNSSIIWMVLLQVLTFFPGFFPLADIDEQISLPHLQKQGLEAWYRQGRDAHKALLRTRGLAQHLAFAAGAPPPTSQGPQSRRACTYDSNFSF